MNTLFSCRQVSFAFGEIEALSGVTLDIASGEIVGIVGPNGAGKSTLIKILAGLLRAFEGEIFLEHQPLRLWSRADLARKVAFVPQETQIVFPFSVEEVVLMGRYPHRKAGFFESKVDLQVARNALEMADCSHLSSRYFNQLSGGERQLVVLASCLAQQPEILFLDEPTLHLDIRHQLHVFNVLRKQHVRARTTLVVVTHDLDLAMQFCDRILYLKDARLLAQQSRPFELDPKLIQDVFDVDARKLEDRRILLSFRS